MTANSHRSRPLGRCCFFKDQGSLRLGKGAVPGFSNA